MPSRIVMSKLSPTMEEGRILKWLRSEDDAVRAGDVLLEVETDKATMEVEATASGVLRKILVAEGETVPTGTLLGVIGAPDEDISGVLAAPGIGGAPAGVRPAAPSTVAEAPAAGSPADATPAGTGDGGRIKASPLARRLAGERGITLREIRGSGPGGRILKRDIEASAAGAARAPAAPRAALGPDVPFERVELTQIRKAIARNLVESLGPVPHYYLTTEIDMGRVIALRTELNESLADSGLKIGINEILIKAAAQALAEHPGVNVAFAGDHIRKFRRVDVGLAVAVPDGLITPVLRDAGAKGLRQIAVELGWLVERARERKLAPEEYQGATFTVSNLGMYGIDEFTAVINPPAATILAVGATQEKPVVVDGSIAVRSRMRVTLSCDHRAVDGALGAAFLATFRAMLENPLRLVL